MLEISESDIRQRIERDNPWWANPNFSIREAAFPRRVYFDPFKTLAMNPGVQRAAVLYASVDTPIYSRVPLEKFFEFLPAKTGNGLVIFDEIQYLKDWETHLKDLVDNHPGTKIR